MLMVRIEQHRKKCIGCFACVQASSARWRMSRKDGKSVLVGSTNIKEIYSVIVGDDEYTENKKAEKNCPVKIIQVKKL